MLRRSEVLLLALAAALMAAPVAYDLVQGRAIEISHRGFLCLLAGWALAVWVGIRVLLRLAQDSASSGEIGPREEAKREYLVSNARKVRVALALGVILLTALSLRLWGLNSESLWCDEYFTLRDASYASPIKVIAERAHRGFHLPLYYVLVHVSVRLLGSSEFALRLPSVLIGVLTVFVVYVAGSELCGTEAGVLSAASVAILPQAIYYSQEARMYALLSLLSAGILYWSIRLVRRGDRSSLIGILGTGGALLYTHYYGAVVLLSSLSLAALALASGQRSALAWKRLGIVSLLTFSLLAPWGPVLVADGARAASVGSTTQFVAAGEILDAVLCVFFPSPHGRDLVSGKSGILAFIAIVVALGALLRTPRRHDGRTELLLWTLGFLVLPMVMVWTLTQFVPFWAFARTVSLAIVPVGMVCGVAIANSRRSQPVLCAALVCLLATVCFCNDRRLFSEHQKAESREAAAFVSREELPKDTILVVADFVRDVFVRYYSGSSSVLAQSRRVHDEVVLRDFIEEIWQPGGRLWLVLSHKGNTPLPNLFRYKWHDMKLLDEREFVGIRVLLFTRTDDPFAVAE